jgi:hypothetical protein
MKPNGKIQRAILALLFATPALALLPAGGGAPQEGERQDASA